MYLKQSKSHGRTYLSIVEAYRLNNKVKQKTIIKIGFLEDLKKQYDDPIAHFKEIAKEMNKEQVTEYTIKNLKTKVIDNTSKSKNLGYVALREIYKELGLEDFFKDKNKNLRIDFDLHQIFSLLVYSRILYPGSKKETFDKKDRFFENFEGFDLKDVYRSLDYFNNYKEDIEKLLWNSTKDRYNRRTDNLYYDCTNYYFEINYNDTDLVDEEGNILEKGYRKRGPEKNNRPDSIIEMGLLMDEINIPISYDLFSGNESEKLSLLPITRKTKINCNLGRVVIVADRGLDTSDNIYHLAGKNVGTNLDGYIYGQSVRGADAEFKSWVLNQEGYFEEVVKAEDGTPETASGSASYINNIKFDKQTGAVADGLSLSLNLDKIKEEEKYDGYYSIVTSELNMSDKELRNKYRGLSKIEETFKITKSELDARPVLVWTPEHIESHFLTCFVSLVITRLLEKKLENKYSIHKIINSLKNYNSIPIEHYLCIQNYTDEIIDDIQKIYNIDFSRKYLTLSEIKKNFSLYQKKSGYTTN